MTTTSIWTTTSSTYPPSSSNSSPAHLSATLIGGAEVLVTTRSDGDFAEEFPPRWVTLHQVHGSSVVFVNGAAPGRLLEGDALVSASSDVILAVRGADCPLIGLSSKEGVIAAVHAGWRGLLGGVIDHAASSMREHGAHEIHGVLGPYVHPECYTFSEGDLEVMVQSFGDGARASAPSGEPALDLLSCVKACFSRAGIEMKGSLGGCTGCSPEFFSWRVRREDGRHVLAITRRTDGMSLTI